MGLTGTMTLGHSLCYSGYLPDPLLNYPGIPIHVEICYQFQYKKEARFLGGRELPWPDI